MYVSVAISVQFAVNRIASRSGVVAMSRQAPRSGQPATFISLAELARANPAAGGMAMLGPTMVSSGILPDPPASGQVRPVWAPDVRCPNVEKVGFFLLLIEQAENANFVRETNIGLMVTVLGPESKQPRYPPRVKHIDFLVTYAGGRKEQLKVALPLIVAAFSQGRCCALPLVIPSRPAGIVCHRLFTLHLECHGNIEVHRHEEADLWTIRVR